MKQSEPWYVHAVLYVIIIVLAVVLIQVAIVEPTNVVEKEKYYKDESRLRMTNLKEGEILWQKKYGYFTDSIDSLISFIKNDPSVHDAITGTDSVTHRSSNPFVNLISTGQFTPDSLKLSPKTSSPYTLQVDTSISADTVIDRRGKIVKIDSTVVRGLRYLIEGPDGFGKIGDVRSDALKNTASWE